MCDFGLANQVWKFLEFYAKCVWSLRISGKLFENFNFGKIGSKTCVFEKHFISYSCIFSIKYYALRSFCIKLLCFSKNWFFQNFGRSKLFLDQSKLQLKFWFGSMCLDRCSIGSGSIEGIFDQSSLISINRKSYREFLKPLFLTCFVTCKLFRKLFSLSIRSVQDS